ncbi:MAG: fumarylacetoacetate hydrolase family protein [Desulfuromonadales bacterium]|nr:fumarylacetoacetate hydrolase family protein [Desulfuromonadales bacterium]
MFQIVPRGTTTNYQVGKLVCVARNYVDHIRELNNAFPDEPVMFTKPTTSIIVDGEKIIIPPYSTDCHHEVELAVLIGATGKDIPLHRAFQHVAGYGVALDMTLRDVQSVLKAKGLPWDKAKGFDTSCPLSSFVAAEAVADPQRLRIALRVNGALRQDATTALMMRGIPELIAAASAIFTLEAGDILLTGTPAGVAAVNSGDVLEAEIEQVGRLRVTVA